MRTQTDSVLLVGSGSLLAVIGALLGGFACSEESGADGELPGFGAGTSSGPVAGSGATPPSGSGGTTGSNAGSSNVPNIPVLPTGGTGGGSSMVEADASCATGTAKASLMPVNMFIQFDRSGSMLDDDKWAQATQALSGFFRDPATAGLRVALRFFPHDLPAAGCTDQGCNAMACAQPLVALGPLLGDAAPTDMQEQRLVEAIMASAPPPPMQGGRMGGMAAMGGGTPIYAALDGALQWATANLAMTPNEKSVVVLVTDGEANGCNEDIDDIAGLAAAALTRGISTYAIGIEGAQEDDIHAIARAGGTTMGYFAGNASTAQQDLIAALNAIRGSELACDFPMPAAQMGGMRVDPTKINVKFTPSTTGMEELIGQAPPNDCSNGGWSYDNPAAPTRISLCPSTCERVKADMAGKLDVVLGCQVIPIVPK